MGARSSKNTSQNNRSDGHLLEYFRDTFGRGGGAAPPPPPPTFDASGGTKIPAASSGDGYVYHIFTGASSTLSRNEGPTTVPLNILLVGGGGGGASGEPPGGAAGGGGGAGGFVEVVNQLVSFASPITITVGGGGTRSPNAYNVWATPGVDSTFAPGTPQSLVALGGGGASAYSGGGLNGGSVVVQVEELVEVLINQDNHNH